MQASDNQILSARLKMTEINNVVDVLSIFPLSRLSEDWVKSVWESDFTEAEINNEEVLLDLDNDILRETLDSLLSCLDHWINDETEEGMWTLLVESEISLKAIIAFLSHLLLAGHKKSADLSQKELGILAGRAYCKLVLVPGSQAFNIFHPELFEKILDFLKQFTALGSLGKRKRTVTPSKSSHVHRSSKSRRKKRSNGASIEDSNEDLGGSQGGDDDDDDEVHELAPQEIAKLRKYLHALLVDMVGFLETFSVRQSMSSSHHCVQVLAPLTRHDPDTFDGNFESSVTRMRQSVPALAFKCLLVLCSPLHGHVGSLMNAVSTEKYPQFKDETCNGLLSNLLMLIGDNSVQTVTKQLQTTRDHAVHFICMLMKQGGDRGLVSVRTLLQHMCTKVTDRADYRTKVAQAVVMIAKDMPVESYSKLVQWFYKLSKHSQMNNRGFALEIVTALLATPEVTVTEAIHANLRPYTTHRSLLGILLDRCSDKAPTVRARAIACFAQCLSSRDESIVGTMKEIVTPQVQGRVPNVPRLIKTPGASLKDNVNSSGNTSERSEVTIAQQTIEGSTAGKEGGAKDNDSPLHSVNLTPGFDPNLSDSEGVFSMLRRRARDEKVNVRKSALQALEAAVRFEMPNYTKQNVEVLKDHCRDPGLSVRKQALQSLTDMLMDWPKDAFLQSNWLLAALPLVIDRESTLSEKCMETLEELILANVVLNVRSKSESHDLAWSLLDIIARPQSVDQRRYLQKACHHWSRQGKIKPALISALESHIGTANNSGAWMLLAEIAPAAPKINHTFLLNYWQKNAQQEKCAGTMNRVLTVMKCVTKHLPSEDRDKLIRDLNARLMRFDSPTELISVLVNTLSKLCNVQAKETGITSTATDWSNELLAACDKYLSRVVLEHDGAVYNEDRIVCHLFTLGEVVQLCPGNIPKRVFLLVQSMIASPCITGLSASQSQPCSQNDESQSGHITLSPSNDRSGDQLCGSQTSQGSGDSQGTQSSQASQPLTQFRGSSMMSSRVRAFAFITLGKLCLQNESLAKKCIAALARELETSKDPAIRNNVVIIMCDLCVRYTTTANHYISNIASCLKDPTPLVRKQTLTLITRLLQEDFLKWKGALFYRFISTLLDNCDEIQKFGEFCLLHMLVQRHPNMFFQHFMECVFHFNDYREHTIYNQFNQSEKDRELFSLKGDKNTKKRLTLYRFLLDKMSDDHRFQLQSKLVQEVLGGIVDGILPINKDTSDILKDTLAVLSCREIKLSSLKVRPSDDVAGDEIEMAAVVVATAKKTIITQVLKKNVIENIVPIVVSLKHMMEKERSPLLKELLMYLRELMKDYKSEVKEILSADRQLATEIEFDLRKFEEQQLEAAQRSVSASAQSSPVVRGAKSPVPVPNVQSLPPSTGSSPRTPGSPRTPALKAGVGRSRPKGAPPVLRIAPARNSPREAPLSTLAVLNSARRMITQPHTSAIGIEMSGDEDNQVSPPAGTTPTQTMPCLGRINRAISTPSVAMSNITFHGDANMTFMPPSPISETSMDQIRFDDNTGVSLDKESDDKENDNTLILMKSPLARAPKPRVWNISSPAPKKPSHPVLETDEEESITLAYVSNGAANQTASDIGKVSQSKQRTKSSGHPQSKGNKSEENKSVSERVGRRRKGKL